MSPRGWPSRLWLIRHGQSEGNLADEAARAAQAEEITTAVRDPDVALSPLGAQQARAVGRIWAAAAGRPALVLCSPYVRATETARLALADAGIDLPVHRDERLRERDLGLFDGLTGVGIARRYPAETARRARLGKLYYRPPSGESWADVALRVRSVLSDLREAHAGQPVAVFSHQAVLLVFRYVLEGLAESTLLEIDQVTPMGNGAVSEYVAGADGALTLVRHNDSGHLDATGTPATASRSTHAAV